MIRRHVIDNTIEEKILIGLITNTSFCKEIIPLIKKDIFVISYSNIVFKWCADYYKSYHKAPEKHIQDIFELSKNDIKEEEKELVSSFLSKLSANYEAEAESNIDFLKDKAFTYIKKRSLKNISEKIQQLVDSDKIDEAEKEMTKYKQVAKETSASFNPFTKEEVKKYFDTLEDKTNQLLTFSGGLGKLLGTFERHWLVGILAPSKRGKTFWQQEFAVQAIMEKRKVFFVSLEMDKERIKKRLYRRLTGFADRTDDYIFPCFDCLRNQNGSCKKPERTNVITLLKEDTKKPKYEKTSKYTVCTSCRGIKKDYIPATWFTTIRKEGMRQSNTMKTINGFTQAFGDRLRIRAYPKFSANVSDIVSALHELELNEDFIPDVIIVDYADILAPEDSRITGRDRIDDTWKTLGRMADEHHCLVVSASQSNRGSFKKKYVEDVDVAEDIRKIANSDLFISLNQTKEEKREGVIRINIIADRDSEFDSFKSCLVLQQLSVGQVCLDSEIVYGEYEDSSLLDT